MTRTSRPTFGTFLLRWWLVQLVGLVWILTTPLLGVDFVGNASDPLWLLVFGLPTLIYFVASLWYALRMAARLVHLLAGGR